MILSDIDIDWLSCRFPSLLYDPENQKITGELSFCACYDRKTKKLKTELSGFDEEVRTADSFLCDVFEIEIRLDHASIGQSGWPEVREVGGRRNRIAGKFSVTIADLHFYSDTEACCLGIRYSRDVDLTVERFLYDLVIPFFYRLSYVDHFGIEAARVNLWGEYSHGRKGFEEHGRDMGSLARLSKGRNQPCPCGSGRKYKKCCLNEVKATSRYVPKPVCGIKTRIPHERQKRR